MNKKTTRLRWMMAASVGLGAFAGAGCGDGGAGPGANGDLKALYATVDEVYTDTGSISYVVFMGTPDVSKLNYANAIESTTGRATIGTVDGKVFVAGPDEPVIARYAVAENGLVTKERDSFANQGEQFIDASEWSTTFASATKAYTVGANGQTIVWNPSAMEVIGTIPFPAALVREGKMPACGQGVIRGNRMVRAFGFADPESGDPDPDSVLLVYDLDSDTVVQTATNLRCPAISNLVTADEAGNLYFSNWLWSVGFAKTGKIPENCVLRLPSDSTTLDPSWTFDYKAVTAGHEGASFSPGEPGKALFTVFYDEELPPIDAATDPWKLAAEKKWRLWSVDLKTRATTLVQGLDWIIGGAATFRFDNRVFTGIPMDGKTWSTDFFEIKDDRATPTFKARGFAFQFIKVR